MTQMDLEECIVHARKRRGAGLEHLVDCLPRTVPVFGLAHALPPEDGAEPVQCEALDKNGKRCTAHARWRLLGTAGWPHAVCRTHANAGERRGALTVSGGKP